MRLWILFGCGVLILGAAIWPFGRKTEQLAPAPVPPAVTAKPATPEPPRPAPDKVIEVIDLARAYEPVREPEEPAGAVNPAAYIQELERPKPIPPAIDLDCTYAEVLTAGCAPIDLNLPKPEQLDVMPREVK